MYNIFFSSLQSKKKQFWSMLECPNNIRTHWLLNYWCHMDYFNDILNTFLGLERVSCFAVYAGSESSQISSKIS